MRRIGIVLMVCAAALAGCGFAGCAQPQRQQVCTALQMADAVIAPLELDPDIGPDVEAFRQQAAPIIEGFCAWANFPDGEAPKAEQLWNMLNLAQAYAQNLPPGDDTKQKIVYAVSLVKVAMLAAGFQPPHPPEPAPPQAWMRTRWQLDGWAVPT